MAIGIFTLRQQLRGLLSKNWTGTIKTPYVEYLVVGGGGNGGDLTGASNGAGGGGGGGVVTGLLPVTTGASVAVTVGAGSARFGTTTGGNSVLGSITAVGGGAGARTGNNGGAAGGSGGGGSGPGYPSGYNGVFGQGNAGGYSPAITAAGGGGGAGTKGLDGVGTVGGAGGAGIASAISGTVTAYGGGGGGGGTTAGAGGVGGGTAGGSTDASPNTGGGGGGSSNLSNGFAGGSGIVIVSYPDIYAPLTTTGSPTVSTSGSGSLGLGSTTYLRYAGQTPFALGSGDFTIEGWFYASAVGSLYILCDFRTGNGAYPYLFKDTDNKLYYYVNTASRISGTTALAASTWYHIAVCRIGTNTRMFLNGSQEGATWTDTTTYLVSGTGPTLFAANDGLYSWNGYASNFRVVKGVGVYTGSGASAFVVPTAPLQATQSASTGIAAITGTSTSLLLNTVSGAWSADSSTNSYAPASVGGTPNWNQSSPFATGLGYKNRVYSWTTTGSGTFTV